MSENKVASNDSSVGANIPKNHTLHWSNHTIFYLVIAIILVGLITAVIYGHYHKTNKETAISNACTTQAAGDVLSNSVLDLKMNNISDLTTQVLKIQKLPDYNNDPNCLYVLTMYGVYTFNTKSAQNNLNQFNKIYKNEPLYPKLTFFANVSTLRNYVSIMVKQQDQIQHNLVGASSQPAETKKK